MKTNCYHSSELDYMIRWIHDFCVKDGEIQDYTCNREYWIISCSYNWLMAQVNVCDWLT